MSWLVLSMGCIGWFPELVKARPDDTAALEDTAPLDDTGVPVPELPRVVVSEFMANPNAVVDLVGEWLELRNLDAREVDIGGWIIGSGDDALMLPSPTVMGGHGKLVLGTNGDEHTNGGLRVDLVYERTSLLLGNNGDLLYLKADGAVIWQFEYGASGPGDSGVSANLSPDVTTVADAMDHANWCDATSTYGMGDLGTPRALNDPCPGDVIEN
jgi:hypothetical protein